MTKNSATCGDTCSTISWNLLAVTGATGIYMDMYTRAHTPSYQKVEEGERGHLGPFGAPYIYSYSTYVRYIIEEHVNQKGNIV